MKEAGDTADLVLVLGTSLSGLNSDRVAKDPAKRSLQGRSLGTVIINLQQTQHRDGILRESREHARGRILADMRKDLWKTR